MDNERKLALAPEDQPVWEALEGLRSSSVVAEARDYATQTYQRRNMRPAFWGNLFSFPHVRLATAATCAVAFIGAAWWLNAPETLKYATRVGEIRSETLADGSRVILDTDTQIQVAFTGAHRQITLIEGRAHFEVAHDTARPFKVIFGKGTVTAVGTAFDVTAFANNKTVTLLEGKVVVEGAARSRESADQTMLSPGQRIALASDGRLTPPRMINPEGVGSWQRGRIDLTDLTLRDALTQVNRYSSTKIVVREPSLEDRRVSGVFRIGDVNAVVSAVCTYFDLEVVQRTADAVVLAKP